MESNPKPQRSVKDRFNQGCEFVFKKWTAFRMALDNNPKILTYYNEDQSVLEINEMLSNLFDEMFMTLNSGSFAGKSLLDELSDILYGFMNDYFNIILEDESEIEVANVIINLYNELKKGEDKLFNKLQNYKTNIKFNIEYPILGNQTVIFEKSKDEESEEESLEEDEKDVEMKDANDKNDKNNEDDDGFVEVKKGKGKGY